MSRKGMAGVSALALVALAISTTACGSGSRPPGGTGSVFRNRVRHFLNVRVVRADRDGKVALDLLERMPGRRKSILCDELTEGILFPARLEMVMTCLGREDEDWSGEPIPGMPETRDAFRNPRVRAAMERARRKLETKMASDPGLTSDPRSLGRAANELFDQALEDSGILEEMERAWKKHAEGHSSCYEEIRKDFESRLETERDRAASRGFCKGWESGLDVCTSSSATLEDHIYLHGKELEPKQFAAAQRLMGKGLGSCLAKIIETDSPELAGEVSALGRSESSIDENRLRRRVWDLWRARGVEALLDRTVARGGEVSGEDVDLLEDCIAGALPPRTDPAPGGDRPGS